MDVADLPVVRNLAVDAPVAVRLLVGACGALVLLWGARIYRPALFLASFALGAIVSVALLDALQGLSPVLERPEVVLGAPLVCGAIAMGVAALAHRVALVGVGALCGLALGVAVVGLAPQVPVWVALVGVLLGAVLVPWLFPTLLKVVTPGIGAVLVAWAAAWPFDLRVLAALWGAGVVWQVGVLRAPDDAKEDKK